MKHSAEPLFLVLSHKEIDFDNRVHNQIAAVRGVIPNCEVVALPNTHAVSLINPFLRRLRNYLIAKHRSSDGPEKHLYSGKFRAVMFGFFWKIVISVAKFIGPTTYRLIVYLQRIILKPNFNFLGRIVIRTIRIVSIVNQRFEFEKNTPILIIANDIDTLAAGIICKFKFKARLIYDMHEFERSRHPVGSRFDRLWIVVAETLMFPFVDYIWTVSFSIKRYYKSRFAKNKISLILNAPYVTKSSKTRHDNKKSQKNLRKFISVGNVTYGRNFVEILDAFERHKNFNLTIVGDINPKVDREFNITDKINNIPNVNYLPRIPPSQLENLLSSNLVSLCLYDTSIKNYEFALPNKLLLALVTETPIVCFKSLEIEILEDRIGTELNKITHLNELFLKKFTTIAMPKHVLYFYSMKRQKLAIQKIVKTLI